MNKPKLILRSLCILTLGSLVSCETIVVDNPGYDQGPRPPYGGGGGWGGGRYDTPEVTKVSNAYFVTFPGGRTAKYDRWGNLLRNNNCSPGDLSRAKRAVETYMREQGEGGWSRPENNYRPEGGYPPSYNRPSYSAGAPEVRPRADGMLEVMMPRGGVVLYDGRGRLVQKGGTVSTGELMDANRAVQSYLREQGSSRGYNGV